MTCIENAKKCDDPATSSYNPQSTPISPPSGPATGEVC